MMTSDPRSRVAFAKSFIGQHSAAENRKAEGRDQREIDTVPFR